MDNVREGDASAESRGKLRLQTVLRLGTSLVRLTLPQTKLRSFNKAIALSPPSPAPAKRAVLAKLAKVTPLASRIDPERLETYDSRGLTGSTLCCRTQHSIRIRSMVHVRHLLCVPAVLILGLLACSGCQHDESIPHVDGIEVTMTTENFDAEALQSEIPVLVDFGATWCGPCRRMEPAMAYLSVQYKDRVKVGKVDVDENAEIQTQYNVDAFPTFVIFQNGQEVARTVGAMSYRDLSSWLDQHISQ
jgi:thioredoxin 1